MLLHLLGVGELFSYFTAKRFLSPLNSEQNVSFQVPPASESTTLPHRLCPVPPTQTKAAPFHTLRRERASPPCPGRPSLPFKWLLFWFFLLVSSNTYIVWGETASIHTPQKAIHFKAAGEAQRSACPLHSWMSFVQSSGLESFPSQSQAINERWKKGEKTFQGFCLFSQFGGFFGWFGCL